MNPLLFLFVPTVCMLIGGVTAIVYLPGERLTVASQHFAAGVVFAAVAKELLPQVGAAHAPLALVIGFTLGIAVMLLAKWFSHRLEDQQRGGKLALGLVSAVLIDVFIDGMLIGVAFLAGEKGGVLITIALAIEILFLGLSTTATLNQLGANKLYRIAVIMLLALVIPFSAYLGEHVFAHASPGMMNGILAFGVAALLYLVTEELLVEAHKTEEKIWMPLFFFIGFLLILMLEN